MYKSLTSEFLQYNSIAWSEGLVRHCEARASCRILNVIGSLLVTFTRFREFKLVGMGGALTRFSADTRERPLSSKGSAL